MTGSSIETAAFLDSVEGEISFFRSIMRARPVGMHQHFHVLTMRNFIHKDTGHWISVDELSQKLKSCYDMDALDAIDVDYEAAPFIKSLTSLNSPSSPNDDSLINHPFFRQEFNLPFEFESIISSRRLNPVPSPPSSPETSASPAAIKAKLPKRNGKSKASMAGLVGGESDSSDLTDSGEEGPAPSVVTATDGGETVDGEEEEPEIQDVMPDTPTTVVKSARRKSSTKKTATATSGRSRAPTANSSSRPAKKRKR